MNIFSLLFSRLRAKPYAKKLSRFFEKKLGKKLPTNNKLNIVDGVPVFVIGTPFASFEKKLGKKLSANID